MWGFLFELPLRRTLRRPRPPADAAPSSHPWWAPPDQLDVRATVGLSLLCVFSVFSGYMGTLLSQTNTYFKQDFGVSDGAVGVMLAATRVGALLALAIVALADRRGRRWVLVFSAVVGAALTATGALAPSLLWLGVSQTLARAFSTALVLVISIIAVEEMPAGSRAFAVSVLTATAALGAGVAVMLLPVAGLSIWAWRVLYVVPVVMIPVSLILGRQFPETERFERSRDRRPSSAKGPGWRDQLRAMDRGRLILLAGAGFLLALFVLPASSFLNEFLRTDRGFSAPEIVAFQILTSTPGGIGIVIGGRLADRRGRRLIGSIGVGLGTGFTVRKFLSGGPAMWVWSLVGTVLGAMAVPALAVYGPELFPTDSRGTANGLINLFSVIGSATGLALAGWLADRAGGLGTAMAILAIGPVGVVAADPAPLPRDGVGEPRGPQPHRPPAGRGHHRRRVGRRALRPRAARVRRADPGDPALPTPVPPLDEPDQVADLSPRWLRSPTSLPTSAAPEASRWGVPRYARRPCCGPGPSSCWWWPRWCSGPAAPGTPRSWPRAVRRPAARRDRRRRPRRPLAASWAPVRA